MISGFEEYTSELTKEELRSATQVVAMLHFSSKENPITSAQISRELGWRRLQNHGARVRKIINWIRLKKIVPNLVASSRGYYRTNDPQEIERYVKSLRQRIEAIEAVIESFEQ